MLARSLCLVLVVCVVPGCCVQPPSQIRSSMDSHVVILPGITGTRREFAELRKLIETVVPGTSAQVWDWTALEPTWALGNLTDSRRNRRRAKALADALTLWRTSHPRGKLYLCAFSGGAGIICFTSEILGDDFRFDRVVIISGAVSPYYDLRRLLQQSRGGIYNYYSPNDWWRICDGTRWAGTIDRTRIPSCGHVGFIYPHNAPWSCKLKQLPWRPDMIEYGNRGKHFEPLARAFATRYLLPLFAESTTIPDEWR